MHVYKPNMSNVLRNNTHASGRTTSATKASHQILTFLV